MDKKNINILFTVRVQFRSNAVYRIHNVGYRSSIHGLVKETVAAVREAMFVLLLSKVVEEAAEMS